jgi:hypothetical protein
VEDFGQVLMVLISANAAANGQSSRHEQGNGWYLSSALTHQHSEARHGKWVAVDYSGKLKLPEARHVVHCGFKGTSAFQRQNRNDKQIRSTKVRDRRRLPNLPDDWAWKLEG